MQTYKVRLANGRILGPIDLERIRTLILKNHIVGGEQVRPHPVGEWKDLSTFPEIAELLVAKVAGTLKPSEDDPNAYRPITGGPAPDAGVIPTEVMSSELSLPTAPVGTHTGSSAGSESFEEDDDRTIVAAMDAKGTNDFDDDRTVVGVAVEAARKEYEVDSGVPSLSIEESEVPVADRQIYEEKTIVFQRGSAEADTSVPGAAASVGKGASRPRQSAVRRVLMPIIAILAVGMAVHEFFTGGDEGGAYARLEPVRPRLPAYVQGKSDPDKSGKIYAEAMRFYVLDNVIGYRKTVDKLLEAASLDISNVKALAMLASSYLNLIDSSNKDENYFSVISKLIEMSRAKAVDLPETVIADVEFYVTVNKADAAQSRIVEYTKSHEQFGSEMFYFLALSYMARGDGENAARYLGQYPDNKAFSAKVFYLRGQIAEKLADYDAAVKQYEKAVAMNPEHARSRLRIASVHDRLNRLRDAQVHLDSLAKKPYLLPPKEQAYAYYLHAKLQEMFQKWDYALGDVERAVKLDRENHDYLLELYTLRAKVGGSVQAVQKDARMYFFLSEGEKQFKAGQYQEALVHFLQAREANLDSPLPHVKIGDMFVHLNDIANARLNYQKAAEKSKDNIEIWSKYMKVLIQSYEWDEAQKAMDRFRKLPVPQSAIDKAAADMYSKQGRHVEAQTFYKKAMSRSSIDPDVYIAYAKSLMATKNYKDAPFFFALALRFDPLNMDAIIGTSRCIAEGDSIDRAISMLQDELQKTGGTRLELLAAIGDYQIQKGDWDLARQTVEQLKSTNPEFAPAYRLEAQVFMGREGVEKDVLEKALIAWKGYSDRNASDPSGYLERYRIFVRRAEFEKASDELSKVYALYPKYPNLHFFKGALYGVMGNHKAAIEEYTVELKNNPTGTNTMIALGKEYIEEGMPNEALAHFNKAMQLLPQNAEPKHQAGYANYLLKNYQGAVALYQAALLFDKGNPLIYKRLGMAYRDMGDNPSASQAFRKYLEMEPDATDKAEFQKYL